jgi:hypothetical protein
MCAFAYVSQKRKYTPKEYKLVNDYLAAKYPTKTKWKRVRLGPLPDVTMSRLFKVANLYADAIVWDEPNIIIIEAKMKPVSSAIGQLEAYAKLFPQTPDFSEYKDDPIKLVLLTTYVNITIQNMCKEKGIEYVVFAPSWVADYWRERNVES